MTTNALLHAPVAAHRSWHPGALFRFTIDHFLLLPLGGLIAIVWANSWPERYFTVAHDLAFIVNEIGMALFFALVAQEVVEEVMPGGALHKWRRWTLPAVGGGRRNRRLRARVPCLCRAGNTSWCFRTDGPSQEPSILLSHTSSSGRFSDGTRPFHLCCCWRLPPTHRDARDRISASLRRDPAGWHRSDGRGPRSRVRLPTIESPHILALFAGRAGRCHGGLFTWTGFIRRWRWCQSCLSCPMRRAASSCSPMRRTGVTIHHGTSSMSGSIPIQAVLFLFGLVNAGVLLTGYDTGRGRSSPPPSSASRLASCRRSRLAVALGLHMPARFHWRDLVVLRSPHAAVSPLACSSPPPCFPVGPVLAQLKIGAVATGVGVPLTFGIAWFLHSGRFGHRARPRTTSPPQRRAHVHHAHQAAQKHEVHHAKDIYRSASRPASCHFLPARLRSGRHPTKRSDDSLRSV